MGKRVRIPAGNTTNEHYNFVVTKPLVADYSSRKGSKMDRPCRSYSYMNTQVSITSIGLVTFLKTVKGAPNIFIYR